MSILNWLFKKKPELPEPPPEFLQADAPDWLVDIKGQEFPGGRRFSIRAQVHAAARTATADIVRWPATEGAEPVAHSANLPRADLDRLLVILGFSFPQDFVDIPGSEHEGISVNVTVFRRDPLAAQGAACNLSEWLDTRKSAPPVVEIGKMLWRIGPPA